MLVSVGVGWSVLPQTMAGNLINSAPLRPITRTLGSVIHAKRRYQTREGLFGGVQDYASD